MFQCSLWPAVWKAASDRGSYRRRLAKSYVTVWHESEVLIAERSKTRC